MVTIDVSGEALKRVNVFFEKYFPNLTEKQLNSMGWDTKMQAVLDRLDAIEKVKNEDKLERQLHEAIKKEASDILTPDPLEKLIDRMERMKLIENVGSLFSKPLKAKKLQIKYAYDDAQVNDLLTEGWEIREFIQMSSGLTAIMEKYEDE